jgi:pyrimidine-nucleoside phosphorylase
VFHKKVGDRVEVGEPLCTIHYNAEARLPEARELVERGYRIEASPPAVRRPLLRQLVGAGREE